MAQINGVLPETAPVGITTDIQEIKVHDTARETLVCQDSTQNFPVKNAGMRGCESLLEESLRPSSANILMQGNIAK